MNSTTSNTRPARYSPERDAVTGIRVHGVLLNDVNGFVPDGSVEIDSEGAANFIRQLRRRGYQITRKEK